MTGRTTRADESVRRGRMAKAEQFAAAAELVHGLADEAADVADAYVTLCVHAGIAAADVICAARLGVHARGENHQEAVTLLATADRAASRHLDALLGAPPRAPPNPVGVPEDRQRPSAHIGRLGVRWFRHKEADDRHRRNRRQKPSSPARAQ